MVTIPSQDRIKDIKVHIVVMDVRYDYDKESNDRIGERQLEWLKQVLKVESDVTLIVSGIQVMPDRKFIIECFNWKNKE